MTPPMTELYHDGKLYPHPGQWAAWKSEARFVAVLAGTQSGKTSFLPHWLYREIQKCGSGDYLAATASYDLFKLKFLPSMRYVFEEVLQMGRYWASSRVIEVKAPNGQFLAKNSDDRMWARIILRSAQSPGGFESATVKAVLADEAGMDDFRLNHWEAILRRLSLSQGRVLLGTTLYNLGWLKTEIYDKWEAGSPEIEVIQFPSTMNPQFPPEEYERAKASMQPWRFKMFYEGLYALPPSMIYPSYELVPPFIIPSSWRVVVGVDPSGAHCATIWAAEKPHSGGEWFLFKETFTQGATTAQNVAAALQEPGAQRREVEFVGGAPSETQQRTDWADHGIGLMKPSITSLEAGIDRVSAALGTGRLKVFKNLKGLRDELGGYRRKVDDMGNVLAEIHDKNKYHRLDALRAAVAAFDSTEVQSGVVEWAR